MPFIIVTPLSRLQEQLRLHRPRHVITLTSNEVVDLAADWPLERLVLRFHDISAPQAGLSAPDMTHVRQLLDFIALWDRRKPLLIHCYAGVSRSPAAAYIARLALDGQADAAELAGTLRQLSPSATPNRLLIALADQALGAEGRMIAAIDRIGRGQDAFEGEVFRLPVAEPASDAAAAPKR